MPRTYYNMIGELFKDTSYAINKDIRHTGVALNFANNHIIDRAMERDIDILNIRPALNNFQKHLCEFVYLSSLPREDRPWSIELRGSPGVIIVLARRNESVWSFKTVLDPARHSKHADEKTTAFYNTIEIG